VAETVAQAVTKRNAAIIAEGVKARKEERDRKAMEEFNADFAGDGNDSTPNSTETTTNAPGLLQRVGNTASGFADKAGDWFERKFRNDRDASILGGRRRRSRRTRRRRRHR
jgi:hypothetical protein